jgi:hypothetical protein
MRTLLIVLLAAAPAFAQTENVEVEPVTCWWRTTATAVRAGEPFDVVLTCSFLQTDAARAVADESRLEPSVVQLAPFDVIGGARAKDIETASRRFVQYEYRLRLVAENTFGADVTLQPVEIAYRIESNVGAGEALAGRDLTYALPPLTMRLVSLVPDTARDIREAPVATFAAIEDAGFRGTMFRVLGAVLMLLGALVVAMAAMGVARRRRARDPHATRALSDAAVLQGVRRELADVQQQARASGWTADLAGRALAAIRIVAAYEGGRPVTQHEANGRLAQRPSAEAQRSSAAEGQLAINGRRKTTVVFAAAVTSGDGALREALARLGAARYGRTATFDAGLDGSLESAMRAADRLLAARPPLERLWAR